MGLRVFHISSHHITGVLHFGNVKFKVEKKASQDDVALVSNPDVVQHASTLWGVDPAVIQKFLCSKQSMAGGRDLVLQNYNLNQAQDARDAMCKKVYAELFQMVIE